MVQTQEVLIVDDDENIRQMLDGHLSALGYATVLARNGAELRKALISGFYGVILLDVQLPDANGLELIGWIKGQTPDNKVIIVTAHGSIGMAMTALREKDAFYVHSKLEEGFLTRLHISIKNAFNEMHLGSQVRQLQNQLGEKKLKTDIVTRSPKMQQILNLISQVSDSKVSVLISGESGTGKELVARAIHSSGKRKNQAFIAINCAGIPENLLESELFGYERGAFTGAQGRKKGKFEVANEGTLFLDEIGELSLVLQAKLLRVLQEQEFERLGGTEKITVDVRILSATNRDLRLEVSKGNFREDLYYRLSVFPITLPPLRERPEDIPLLAEYFRTKFAKAEDKDIRDFSREAMRLITSYPFPGNVRQLENSIAHAMVVCPGPTIDEKDLPNYLWSEERSEALSGLSILDRLERMLKKQSDIPHLDKLEDMIIRQTMKLMDGQLGDAAEVLGIHRTTLYRKLKRLDKGQDES
jgi:DNA-binding NtrC family response regulator